MRTLAFAAVLPVLALSAEQNPAAPARYDADLFRKNTEVVTGQSEFLYWSVQENAIDYATKMHQPLSLETYAIGRVKTASFNCDPAFRCAVSYFNAPKYWEVRGQYTHLISRGNNHAYPPSTANEYLIGTWPVEYPLFKAKSAIMFNYNVFDLMIDRVFNPNPHLRLRMMAGLAMAWIHQDWKVHYFDIMGINYRLRNRWHYTGGGFKIGMTGDWFWGNNFYLTGLSTIGGFMGGYQNIAKQTVDGFPHPIRNSFFNDVRPAFTAQFSIGPSWQKNLSHNRIEIFAGYELNAWINLHEVRRSSAIKLVDVDTIFPSSTAYETWINSGVVAMQGLTTRLTVDF